MPSTCRFACREVGEEEFCRRDSRSNGISGRLQGTRFYIQQHGGYNSSGVLAAMLTLLAGRAADIVFPVARAQHLVDLYLMPALESHPLRVHDPEMADLHIIGGLPWASYVLSEALSLNAMEKLPTLHEVEHSARMSALARELMHTPHYINRSKPFLLIHSGFQVAHMGAALLRALSRGNLIVASSDPLFARDFVNKIIPADFRARFRRGITIPYYAHSLLARVPHTAAPFQIGQRTGIMFHGGLHRFDHGLRDTVVNILSHVRKRGRVPVDLHIDEMTRGVAIAGQPQSQRNINAHRRTAEAYLNSSLCLVPAGDTPSTRRLFDALHAGCVPVLARSWFTMRHDVHTFGFSTSLPFPNLIDWQASTLWFAPQSGHARQQSIDRCLLQSVSWLEEWSLQALQRLVEIQKHGMATFRRHLDYQHNAAGVASALLQETELRLSACSRRGSNSVSLAGGPVDDPQMCPWPQ